MADLTKYEQQREIPRVRAFLDAIAYAETGPASLGGKGYNIVAGGGTVNDLSKHFNQPAQYLGKDGKLRTSNDAGRYQFNKDTWDDLQNRYGLPDFSERSQDLAAIIYLNELGAMDDIIAGRFNEAMMKAGQRWYGIPVPSRARAIHDGGDWNGIVKAYSDKLAALTNGQDIYNPPDTLPWDLPKSDTSTSTPAPIIESAPTGAVYDRFNSPIRRALNDRYRRRRTLVTMPGALTSDNFNAMQKALVAPHPAITPLPINDLGVPTLIQQPPAAAPVIPNPEYPGHQATPISTGITVTPLSPVDTIITPEGVAAVEAPPAEVLVADVSPTDYLEAQLAALRPPVDDFLQVAMLDTPHSAEIMALIDSTPATMIG